MNKSTVSFLSLAALAAFAAPAQAQLPNVTPFSFEVRGGLAIPTGDLKDEGEAETGYTVGGSVGMQIIPFAGIGVYGGYTRSVFGVNDDAVELVGDGRYILEGFDAGVRWNIPTPLIPIDPWIKAGLVYHKITGEDFEEGDFNLESDRGLGFEVGGGLGFSLTNKLSITPGVSYTSFTPQIDDEDADVDLTHIKVDIGLRLRL